MAIDSSEKRFSMMGLGNPVLKLAVPSGSITAAERAVFLDVYSGIALGAVVTAADVVCETYGYIDGNTIVTLGVMLDANATLGVIEDVTITYGFIDGTSKVSTGAITDANATEGDLDC